MGSDEPTTPVTWRDLERIGVIGSHGHGHRIDSLESWRDQIRGMTGLLKAVLGASLLSMIVSLVTLWVTLR